MPLNYILHALFISICVHPYAWLRIPKRMCCVCANYTYIHTCIIRISEYAVSINVENIAFWWLLLNTTSFTCTHTHTYIFIPSSQAYDLPCSIATNIIITLYHHTTTMNINGNGFVHQACVRVLEEKEMLMMCGRRRHCSQSLQHIDYMVVVYCVYVTYTIRAVNIHEERASSAAAHTTQDVLRENVKNKRKMRLVRAASAEQRTHKVLHKF